MILDPATYFVATVESWCIYIRVGRKLKFTITIKILVATLSSLVPHFFGTEARSQFDLRAPGVPWGAGHELARYVTWYHLPEYWG